jgi:Uma2 family endonuclease
MSFSVRWTVAELEALPEPADGTRYEIIDGELYVSRAPSPEHQYTCMQLGTALVNWTRASGHGLATLGPGMIFADDSAVIPDLLWGSRQRFREIRGADHKLHGPTELVIEALSPGTANERRDREAKLKLYDRRGATEYWIVDCQRKNVEVYRRDGPALTLAETVTAAEQLTSPLLPGFAHPVAEIFLPDDL